MTERGVISTHVIDCRGLRENGILPALDKRNQIIIVIEEGVPGTIYDYVVNIYCRYNVSTKEGKTKSRCCAGCPDIKPDTKKREELPFCLWRRERNS